MHTNITLHKPLFLALAPILLLLYLLNPYRGWLVLLISLGGALLLAFLWTTALRRGLAFTHERRYSWAQVGDIIEERFVLRNNTVLPAIWVEIDYTASMPGYRPNRVVSAPAGQETRWTTRGMCSQRGLFTLGPLTLRTGDPFGIFRLEFHHPVAATVLVEPPTLSLPEIRIAAGGRTGESRRRGRSFERSASVSGIREYVPGDPYRLIHWPTTARTGETFIRDLESRPAGDWWIFLDLDRKVQFGHGPDSTIENGVILAASIIARGLRLGNAVGLVTQAAGPAWHPPQRGEAQRHTLMRTLALAEPGPIPIERLLDRARPQFRHSPSLIVITANMDPGWLNGIAPLLIHRIRPTLVLLDPGSYPGDPLIPPPGSEPLARRIAALGLTHILLDAAFFDRPEARPGVSGRWRWQENPRAAIPLERPEDRPWERV